MRQEVQVQCQRCGQYWFYERRGYHAPTRRYCPACKPIVQREKTLARVRRYRAKPAPAPEPPMLSRRYMRHGAIVKAILGRLYREPKIADNGDTLTFMLTNDTNRKNTPSRASQTQKKGR